MIRKATLMRIANGYVTAGEHITTPSILLCNQDGSDEESEEDPDSFFMNEFRQKRLAEMKAVDAR